MPFWSAQTCHCGQLSIVITARCSGRARLCYVVCRPSVRPSVCPSVTLQEYSDHIVLNNLKIITQTTA